MAGMLAALVLLPLLAVTGTLAQSDYDSDVNTETHPHEHVQGAGLPILAPNGCRARGFSVTTVNNGQKVCRGRIAFVDQFNELDSSRWRQDVQISDEPDYEFIVYDKDPVNMYIERGLLHFRTTLLEDKYGPNFVMSGMLQLQECTSTDPSQCSHSASSFDVLPPIQSARISTRQLMSFRYGTIDIRARMPSGDWVYPIITLRSASSSYGPHYASGEIRFPYTVGNRAGHNKLTAGVVLQPHGASGDPRFFSVSYTNTNRSVNYQRQFHIYRLTWSPDGFEFFVDGQSIGKLSPPEGGWASAFDSGDTGSWLTGTNMAPFDQEFYLTIGLAAGGITRFPDSPSLYPGKPWMNTSPKAMLNLWKSRDKWRQSWDAPDLLVAYVKIRALE